MALTIAIAALAGAACLRIAGLPRTREAWALAILCGYCLTATVLLCLGSHSLALAGAVRIAIGVCALGYFALRFARRDARVLPALPRTGIARIACGALVIALGCAFVAACAPVTSWDAGVAHIALPAAYLRAGAIELVPGNNYSAYPQLVHTLFAVPGIEAFVPLSNDFAARLLETRATLTTWSFGFLLCASAYCVARRLAGGESGWIAAAVVATAPIFLDQSSVPGIDVPYAAMVMGALCAMIAWHQDRHAGYLMLAAYLAGGGCGVRHTALLVIALLIVGVAMASAGSRARNVFVFSVFAIIGAAPWLLRAWFVSGFPLYPFFAPKSGALPDVNVAEIGSHSSIQGSGPLQLLTFPWSITMNPAHYGGWSTSPGALWLLLGVIGIVVGGQYARALGAFSGSGLVALFFFQRFARYALPFIVPMMAVAVVPITTIPRLRWVTVPAFLVSCALGLLPALANAALKAPVAIGVESRGDYLARRVERYSAMDWVSRELPSNATVLSLDPRGYYFRQPAYTNFEALKPVAVMAPDAQHDWLRVNGIRYLFVPNAYIERSPAFRATPVGALLDSWRADTAHFTLVKSLELPDPRSGGVERVDIYEFRSE